MSRKRHNEFEIEDADGNRFVLELPKRHVTSIAGLAMPPVRHWTTRSPFQHGRSHWGYAFQARTVTIGLLLDACGRDVHWDYRQENVGIFNPMNGPLKLRLRRQDRHVYELHGGWYQGGYELQATDMDDPSSVEGASQIEFMDPFWKWITAPLSDGQSRDDDGRTCVTAWINTTTSELQLPFTGPFLLGTETGTLTFTGYNAGTWAAKPVFTVEGPVGDWILTNNTNGRQMSFTGYVTGDFETVTIDVPNKEAYNDDGDDLTPYVGGDFATFELDPGTNSLTFFGVDLDSSGLYPPWPYITACWYVEVLGV